MLQKKRESEDGGYKCAAVCGAVHGEDCEENEDGDECGPEGECREEAELARGGQDEYCSADAGSACAAPTALIGGCWLSQPLRAGLTCAAPIGVGSSWLLTALRL